MFNWYQFWLNANAVFSYSSEDELISNDFEISKQEILPIILWEVYIIQMSQEKRVLAKPIRMTNSHSVFQV